jgi:hypothetical protein
MIQIKRSELKQLTQNRLKDDSIESQNKILVMISTSLAARTSYTVVGEDNSTPKVGDKVIITNNINGLNSSMEMYKGKIATITKFEYPDDEDLVRLDIDGGSWVWDFGKKNDQIELIKKEVNYENLIALHDRLLTQDPPHSSPMEHCSLCVSQEEYDSSFKGQEKGWFRNYKGFKSYRQIIEEAR